MPATHADPLDAFFDEVEGAYLDTLKPSIKRDREEARRAYALSIAADLAPTGNVVIAMAAEIEAYLKKGVTERVTLKVVAGG